MTILEHISAKPDLTNKNLATPLHLACKSDKESVAKFLIGCGVDVNCQDEHGQTPLLVCCIHGHHTLASMIIESAVAGHTPEPLEPNLKDHRGLTPMNCAAIRGDLELCKMLKNRGNAGLEDASPKGCTPLLYAARGGYSELVRFLVERGASPLKQDHAGGTVLHHAIEKGHLDVLRVLIEQGIDVQAAIEVADNAGRTPLYEAIDNNASNSLVSFLIKKRSQGGFGAKVNVVDYNGHSPLYCSVRETNMELVKILIDEGEAKVDLYGTETKF
jgi:ankyrin repeat protein